MTKIKTLHGKNLPPRVPIIGTIAVGLLLDRLNAPGFLWGAIGVVYAVFWIAFFVGLFKSEPVDIFAVPSTDELMKLSANLARLAEAQQAIERTNSHAGRVQ